MLNTDLDSRRLENPTIMSGELTVPSKLDTYVSIVLTVNLRSMYEIVN